VDLTAGPGKLCQALGIRLSDTGRDLCRADTRIRVLDDGCRVGRVGVSGRVGIRHAREQPWRFFVKGHPFVSRMPASPHV
jgi:DNA-3-methyladenine glycosylase